MISIESSAKSVQKAIELGLEKLDKTMDEVDIKIISSGGLFKKAKVEITVLEPEKSTKTSKSENQLYSEKNNFLHKDIKFNSEASKNDSKPMQPKQHFKQNNANQNDAHSKPVNTENRQDPKPFVKAENRQEPKPFVKAENRQEPKPFTRAKNRQGFNDTSKPFSKNQKAFTNSKPKIENNDSAHEDLSQDEQAFAKSLRPRAAVDQQVTQASVDFVSQLLAKMSIQADVTHFERDGELTINIKADNGALIGYRGETLNSIEYLTSLAINKSDDKYYRINLDCNDYRSKRIQTLTELAKKMAEKSLKTGRKVVLEPMNSSSRKVIHSVLSENDRIITKSEGKEPSRRIIIIPKRSK